jgi:hypothetical protein
MKRLLTITIQISWTLKHFHTSLSIARKVRAYINQSCSTYSARLTGKDSNRFISWGKVISLDHYKCAPLRQATTLHTNIVFGRDKHIRLLTTLYGTRRKAENISTWAQCYKTFYGRNLLIFVISYSVCK